MRIVKPSFRILDPIDGDAGRDILRKLERIGRLAYKSEDKIIDDSHGPFVRHLCQELHHESVIEHASVSVHIVCDRGVSHELVRHRLASFTQESTRYCNYTKGKFGGEIAVISPSFFPPGTNGYADWEETCEDIERQYTSLIASGAKPQEARSILPNSLKTEIVVTANLREWRHIFRLRTSGAAHPQMREIMIPLLEQFKTHLPELFDDIKP